MARAQYHPTSPKGPPAVADGAVDDPCGLDRRFVKRLRKTLLGFFHDTWWRVDVQGLERIPASGGAVLVGAHRGFVPADAMMLVHDVMGANGRVPRFMAHPGLLRFGPMARVIRGLGGVPATGDAGDWVLRHRELLGVFPEGVRGAFCNYRDAHGLLRTGRPEYVRMAIRHRVPIIPWVTVGSAEVFPILHQFGWKWWRDLTGWPSLPITPTFPFLPLPLPAKWHTWILDPIHIDPDLPVEAAADSRVVGGLASEVETRLSAALRWMVAHRPGIFHGKIFDQRFREDEAWREAMDREAERLASAPRGD